MSTYRLTTVYDNNLFQTATTKNITIEYQHINQFEPELFFLNELIIKNY